MARERTPRDPKVAQERRARLARERERARAEREAAPKPARAAKPARPAKAVKAAVTAPKRAASPRAGAPRPRRQESGSPTAARSPHEGLVGWASRSASELPGRIGDGLLGFAHEVVRVLVGMLVGVVKLVPGGTWLLRRTMRRPVEAGANVDALRVDDGSSWLDAPTRTRAPRGTDGIVLTDAERQARARRRSLFVRRARFVALGVGLVLLAVGAYVVPRADVFRVGHVEVVGASAVGDLEVRERVDALLAGETIFTVDRDAVERRIEQLPFVRDVTVERHLPDGLEIRITEYQPLAVACTTKDCWLVSPDGRILTRVDGTEWGGRVPVVRLETTSKVAPGMRLPNEPGLALLLAVPQDYTLSFTSIDVAPYAVTAMTTEGVEVRFGRATGWPAKLATARRLIDAGNTRGYKFAYVDVSVPGNPARCFAAEATCRDALTTTDVAAQAAARTKALAHIKQLELTGAPEQEIADAKFLLNNPQLAPDAAGEGDAATGAAAAGTGDTQASDGAATNGAAAGDDASGDGTGDRSSTPKDAFAAATIAE